MRPPVVSVITPAYNAAKFIRHTVVSVLAQTMADFEMMIVDDCSEDGIADAVQTASGGDERVRYLRHKVRKGPSGARNTALESARGRFVAFLDSDDLWLPMKLEVQLRFMQEAKAAVTYTSYRRISANGDVISGLIPIPPSLDYRHLLKNTAIATSTAIVDREQVGPFQMINTYYDDYALWLELTKRGFLAHGLQQDLMRYRVVAGSVSRNKLRSARHVWEIYRRVEGLQLPPTIWCFANYVWNGWKRYRA